MKHIEKIIGIVLMVFMLLLVLAMFLPIFTHDNISNPILATDVIFGQKYLFTLGNNVIETKFDANWVYLIAYLGSILPVGFYWFACSYENKPIVKYIAYFLVTASFITSFVFLLGMYNNTAWIRTDIANPTYVYAKNFGYKIGIGLWMGYIISILGALGGMTSLVKVVIEDSLEK